LLPTFIITAFSPAPQHINQTFTTDSAGLAYPVIQTDMTIRLDTIARGLVAPTSLVSPPDGSDRLFVVGQTGLVYIIDAGGHLLENHFLNLRGRVTLPLDQNDPRGLIALTFHPAYLENGRFFIYYTAPFRDSAPHGWDHTIYVVEFSVSNINPNVADPNSEKVLMSLDLPYPTGGQLGFSAEGYLQVTVGEGVKPMFCLDVDHPDIPHVECTQRGNSSTKELEIVAELRKSTASADIIPGHIYRGMAFPSFQDLYLFAINKGNPEGDGGRLFVASPPRMDGQMWRIEELVVSNWDGGRIKDYVRAIDKDASGELYLLSSQANDPRSQSGLVYKIIPHVISHRSVIASPEEYLPAPFRYARLVRPAPVYRSLADVRQNEPFGEHGGGNFWVTIRDQAHVDGRTYYSVAWGWGSTAWVPASYLNTNAYLSSLSGVNLRYWKGEPFAMSFTAVHVRSLPGVIEDETIVGSLPPYSVVTVLETRRVNEAVWYRIGTDQWSHSNYFRLLIPTIRPTEVGPDEKWVEINLAEQTLIAYQGDRPVLATLAATGRRGLETEKGLYRTWAILEHGPMQWENVTPAYSLSSVPWIMYFNRGQGLHGVYWHDLFGTVRSAGCVNLSPHDAHWIFNWAVPEFPAGKRVYYPTRNDHRLWVFVHDSKPVLDAQITAYHISQADLPQAVVLPEAEMLIKQGFIP